MPLYKEKLLNHYQNPRNFRQMKDCTHRTGGTNASCGDRLELFLKVADGKITDAAFQGQGCILAIAGASLLTEKIKGAELSKCEELTRGFVEENIGPVSPGRRPCAELSLRVLEKALGNGQE